MALEALAGESGSERAYLFEAEAALYNALYSHRQIRTFRHQGPVTAASFNRTGDRIVTSSYDKTARIWRVLDGSELAILRGHQSVVERATFSPDGTRVITAARDNTARLWDSASGKQLFVLEQPGFYPTAIFSPDGNRILTSAEKRDPVLWDARTGQMIFSVKGTGRSQARFSPDGSSFAAGVGYTEKLTIQIWSTKDGSTLKVIPIRTWPDSVAFSPDGKRLLVNSWWALTYNYLSGLWDLSTDKEIAAFNGHRSDTRGGTFSNDGRLIVTTSLDGSARLWNGFSGQLLSVLGQETPGLKYADLASDLRDQEANSAFSPDDRLLATPSIDGAVRIWDVNHASLFYHHFGARGVRGTHRV